MAGGSGPFSSVTLRKKLARLLNAPRSRSEPMFPKKPHGRRLGTFIARFLGKGYARSHLQTRESIVQHAVAVEVDLLSVAGLEEAEIAGRIKPHDRSNRRALMMLHLSLRAANLILELPACVFEGIVEGECQIGMAFVRWRRPFHIDLAAVRKRETNMDLVKSAFR